MALRSKERVLRAFEEDEFMSSNVLIFKVGSGTVNGANMSKFP